MSKNSNTTGLASTFTTEILLSESIVKNGRYSEQDRAFVVTMEGRPVELPPEFNEFLNQTLGEFADQAKVNLYRLATLNMLSHAVKL